MLKSNLCDYSGTYILVKKIISVVGVGATAKDRQDDININMIKIYLKELLENFVVKNEDY